MAEPQRKQMELYERRMMVIEESAPSPAPAPARPVRLNESSEDTSKKVIITVDNAPPKKADWLVAITNDCDATVTANMRRAKPSIQRVPDLLRKNKDCVELFEPVVVAFGPYHAANPQLKPMEEHKIAAAKHFASGTQHSIELFYNKVRDVASEAKECYATLPKGMTDEEFVDMMFFDGCFLLQFIDLYMNPEKEGQLTMSAHLGGFVVKDMFLLENQLPFVVLDALLNLKYVDIDKFIHRIVIGGQAPPKVKRSFGTKDIPAEERPVHLLELLRKEILGYQLAKGEELSPRAPDWETFRSVMELKEVGIGCKESKTKQLRDVEFDDGWLYGTLSLPAIVVDDRTRSKLLNLIALEMCPGGTSDYGIISYVWLMDRLIDAPEDVKELRSKGILLNALGSDEQVASVFNELGKDLEPDHQAYEQVTQKIEAHCRNKYKVSIVRMVHTHFDTPWAVIGFCAAVFLLILAVLQTVFTIMS